MEVKMKMYKIHMHHEYEHPKICEICPCKNVLLLELLEYVWMLHRLRLNLLVC